MVRGFSNVYSNTSHVTINLKYLAYFGIYVIYSNTSHVTINQDKDNDIS